VIRRRDLALLFSLAVIALWVGPADPCAPVCDCCPCCAAGNPAESAPCHTSTSAPDASSRRDCPDCLRAAPTLPDGVLADAAGPVAPDGWVALLPPAVVAGAAAAGETLDVAPPPVATDNLHQRFSTRAPPTPS
jgi:hypothetical protein